jgi:two-component system, chemotaxis family, protein-glutamate methylesterase/glutaminase
VMDGLAALREIRRLHPKTRVIMFSTLTTRGASATFEALSLGADDYVAKASNAGSLDQSMASLRGDLVPKIRQFFAPVANPVPKGPAKPSLVAPALPAVAVPSVQAMRRGSSFKIMGIGVSTGGPQALGALMPQLPATLRVPVVLVQHMPPTFTHLLAERLNSASPLSVVEAAHGMELRAGTVYVAPGDKHLRVKRLGERLVTALDQGPQENSCRPSVDVLFRSLAEVCGKDVLSVMLTGMGSDGLKGTQALKAAGAYSLVQDQATSVVWGMPGAVAQAGLADAILPLTDIPAEIARLVGF